MKRILFIMVLACLFLSFGVIGALAEENQQVTATEPAVTSLTEQNVVVNNEPGPSNVTQQETPVVTNEGGTEATPTESNQAQPEAPAPANPPQVTTDRADYVPGENANISGHNFGTNENVRVVITADQTTTVSDQTIVTDNTGSFSATYTVDPYRSFTVVATGQTSGLAASTAFTDCHFILEKQADPESGSIVEHGEEITYTITYGTVAFYPALNTVIRDVLPPYTEFVSATDGGVYDAATNTVTWEPTQPPGQGYPEGYIYPWTTGATVSFTVLVMGNAPCKAELVNQAHIEGYFWYPEGDPQFSEADSNQTVHYVACLELLIAKSGPPTATPGEIYTYTLTYGNTGNITAEDVIVRDTIPKLYVAQIVDAGGGTVTDDGANWIITWPAEDIPANTTGLTKTVKVRLVATFPVGATTITNTAKIGVEAEGEIVALEGEDPSNNASFTSTVVRVAEAPPEKPTQEGTLPVTGDYSILLMLIAAGLAATGFALRRQYAA